MNWPNISLHYMPALSGLNILATRPAEQSGNLIQLLESYGAKTLSFPLFEIRFKQEVNSSDTAKLKKIADYEGIIISSVNGVRALKHHLSEFGMSLSKSLKLYSVGSKTSREAASAFPDQQIIAPTKEYSLNYLLTNFIDPLKPYLRITGNQSDGIPEKWKHIDEIILYQNQPLTINDYDAEKLINFSPNIVLFYSPSAVEAWIKFSNAQAVTLKAYKIGVIGHTTAAFCEKHLSPPDFTASPSTDEGVVSSLIDYYAAHPQTPQTKSV